MASYKLSLKAKYRTNLHKQLDQCKLLDFLLKLKWFSQIQLEIQLRPTSGGGCVNMCSIVILGPHGSQNQLCDE